MATIVSLEEAAKPGAGLMGGFGEVAPAAPATREDAAHAPATPAPAKSTAAPVEAVRISRRSEPELEEEGEGEADAQTPRPEARPARRRRPQQHVVRIPESDDLEPIRVLLDPRMKTVFDRIGAMRTTSMGTKLTIARALRALVSACLEEEDGRLRPIAFDHLPVDEADMAGMWRQWLAESFGDG